MFTEEREPEYGWTPLGQRIEYPYVLREMIRALHKYRDGFFVKDMREPAWEKRLVGRYLQDACKVVLDSTGLPFRVKVSLRKDNWGGIGWYVERCRGAYLPCDKDAYALREGAIKARAEKRAAYVWGEMYPGETKTLAGAVPSIHSSFKRWKIRSGDIGAEIMCRTRPDGRVDVTRL